MGKESGSSKDKKDVPNKKKTKDVAESAKVSLQLPKLGSTADVYKDVTEFEEQEAMHRDPDKDLILFCTHTEMLRTWMKRISELKASGTSQDESQIIGLRMELSRIFSVLKKLNRLEKFRTNQARDKLHKAKQQTDSCHLQLQNLLYEILHLNKEVTKCLQFKSKDEDIDLVSIEEFYADAPESVTRPDITKENEHQLKLGRLEWELMQRKQLAALCEELHSEKENIAAAINKKKAQIDNLAPKLNDILKVALPLQESLGLTTGALASQPKAAYLLPHPLYFLFVQACALRDAGDKYITVRIEGDEEQAQRLKETVVETSQLEDSDSDAQEELVEKRHSHRKKSRVDRKEESRRQLVMAHPLSVVINISLKERVNSISLQFSYLVKLHVVTVKANVSLSPNISVNSASSASKLLEGRHVLTELFPEDFGDDSPNIANFHQLQQVNINEFNTSELGVAYVWVQRVTGLDFARGEGGPVDVPPSQLVCQNSVRGVVAAIKKRLRSRLALYTQMQSFESKRLPNMVEVRKCFPPKLGCELQEWTALTWAGYQELGFTQHLARQSFVTGRDMLYKATLVRGNARCTVAVAVKSCYPLMPPVFALQATFDNKTINATNNNSIHDIEKEVNVFYKELIAKTNSVHNLLTAQFLRIMTDFDILLEASSNPDYPREKIFVQPKRGRNRAWPFKQVEIGEGIFHYYQR